MPKRANERKRLERLQYRLSVAGNGLFLAGSVLYLSESVALLGTLAFVAGSASALLAGLLPQLMRLWICPRESDGDDVPALGRATGRATRRASRALRPWFRWARRGRPPRARSAALSHR